MNISGIIPGVQLLIFQKIPALTGDPRNITCLSFFLERKVVRKKEDKLTYLFPNSGTAPEKKRMYGYIMSHPKQEILKIILNTPDISNKEIAERLQMDRSTVYWHLRQFLDEKMVVSRWDGRNMNYSLSPDVEDILKKYRK